MVKINKEKEMVKTELYFGRKTNSSIRDACGCCWVDEVSDGLISEFLSDLVSPRFPGFTVLHGQGYWQGKPENCFVVVILHEDKPTDNNMLNDIIGYYKKTYYQDTVLRVDSEVNANFI